MPNAILDRVAARIEERTRVSAPGEVRIGGTFDRIECDLETPAAPDAPVETAKSKYDSTNNVIFLNVEGEQFAALKRAIVDAAELNKMKPAQWVRSLVAQQLGVAIETPAAAAPKAKGDEKLVEIFKKLVVMEDYAKVLDGADSVEAKKASKAVEKKMVELTKGTDKIPGIPADKVAAALKSAREFLALANSKRNAAAA